MVLLNPWGRHATVADHTAARLKKNAFDQRHLFRAKLRTALCGVRAAIAEQTAGADRQIVNLEIWVIISRFSRYIQIAVGSGQILGASLTLDPSKGLVVGETTTINADGTLTLDGGSLTTGTLTSDGTFVFHAGTLSVTNLVLGPSARTQIELDGVLSDQLEIHGDASLDAPRR